MVDWNALYKESRTGWDLSGPHPCLPDLVALAEGHVPGVLPSSEKLKSVLVPGCGYGHAADFFSKLGYSVVAVDLSELAIEQATKKYGGPNCKFIAGDFFAADFLKGKFDLVYDRAMYCALDADRRAAYFKKCTDLLKPNGSFLSILFHEIDPQLVENGPPFEADFAALLADAGGLDMSLIFRQDVAGSGPKAILRESLVGFLK